MQVFKTSVKNIFYQVYNSPLKFESESNRYGSITEAIIPLMNELAPK